MTGTDYPSAIEDPDLWIGTGYLEYGEFKATLIGTSNNWEEGYWIAPTEDDNGLIVTGSAGTEDAAYQLWLVKAKESNDGIDIIWKKEYGGLNDEAGYCVQQTFDDGFIIVGKTSSFGSGNNDLWLLKTDEDGELAIEEPPPVTPVTHQPDWHIVSVGSRITLRYENHPQGFHAIIFDASGRKVDELRSTGSSGTITWGEGYDTGVYFIKSINNAASAHKVVLAK